MKSQVSIKIRTLNLNYITASFFLPWNATWGLETCTWWEENICLFLLCSFSFIPQFYLLVLQSPSKVQFNQKRGALGWEVQPILFLSAIDLLLTRQIFNANLFLIMFFSVFFWEYPLPPWQVPTITTLLLRNTQPDLSHHTHPNSALALTGYL